MIKGNIKVEEFEGKTIEEVEAIRLQRIKEYEEAIKNDKK